MVNPEEKKALLTNLIFSISPDKEPSEIQAQLYKLLLRDSKEGKLYKYRFFDKEGYSLDNLKNGTLHCSPSTDFNDPFDCKIGVTFQSLYTAKYGAEFDIFCDILNKFMGVVHKKTSINSCNEDEQRIISKLLKNDALLDFVVENHGVAHSNEEVEDILKGNASVILMLMLTVSMLS